MKASKTDLRVIKTRANIKAVFLELLKKKPPEKITVKELAEQALINKGTFYLHYQDIYALYADVIEDKIAAFCDAITFYDDFIPNPDTFARKFIQHLNHRQLAEDFPYIKPCNSKMPVASIMMRELKKRIYALNMLEPSTTNDIKLDAIFVMLFPIAFRYGQENKEETIAIIANIINSLFLTDKETT